MTRKKTFIFVIGFAIIILGLSLFFIYSSFNKSSLKAYSETFSVMSTSAGCTFWVSDKAIAEEAFLEVKKAFTEAEIHCNIFNPGSEIFKLNETAHQAPFACSPYLWDIILCAETAYQLSDGVFDITAQPLMKLWGFHQRRLKLPSHEEISKTLEIVGFSKIKLDKENKTLFFTQKGIQLDLGGIAKGYAVDQAIKALQKKGITCGLVDLGGNIRTLSQPPPGKTHYFIGIRHPIQKNATCGQIKLLNQAVSTSGNYERFVTIEGKQYTHVVNPKTGYTVEGILGATVITDSAAKADIISTTTFILGRSFAEKVHKKNPETSFVLFIDQKNQNFETVSLGIPFDQE